MIWRLAHPVRGLLAGLAAWVLAMTMLGFGVGFPELLIVTALAVVVTGVVGRSDPKAAVAPARPRP
jgi:hypothetical protein